MILLKILGIVHALFSSTHCRRPDVFSNEVGIKFTLMESSVNALLPGTVKSKPVHVALWCKKHNACWIGWEVVPQHTKDRLATHRLQSTGLYCDSTSAMLALHASHYNCNSSAAVAIIFQMCCFQSRHFNGNFCWIKANKLSLHAVLDLSYKAITYPTEHC